MTSSLPSKPLKARLLGGASATAMVLAASLAVTSPALAQEITGTEGNAFDIGNGTTIINDVDDGAPGTAGDFGAIDTDGGGVNINSITLANDATITVTDSAGGNAQNAAIQGAFTIEAGATGTLIFSQEDDTTSAVDGASAHLIAATSLAGTGLSQGGDLVISVRDGVNQDANRFDVNGSTNLTAITVSAGDAAGAVDGGNIETNIGNGSGGDSFAAATLTINAGDGADAVTVGGNAIVDIRADSGATISGAVTVRGGDGGNGTGGNAELNFADHTGTVTIGGPLTIQAGDPNAGTGGMARVSIASTTFSANGGIVLDNGGAVALLLELNGSDNQTVNGDITVANDGGAEIDVNNAGTGGQTITFTGAIGTDAARLGLLDLNNNDIYVFQEDVFANALEINLNSSARFSGTQSVLESTAGDGQILVGDGTSAAMLTFQGNAAHQGGTVINSMGTLVVDDVTGAGVTVSTAIDGGDPNSANTLRTTAGVAVPTGVTITSGVGTTNAIGLIDVDAPTQFNNTVNAINLDVATGVIAAFQNDLTVNGNLTGAGDIRLDADDAGTIRATFTGNLSGTGSIILEDGATTPGDAELILGGTTAVSVANTIRGDDDNDGELIVSNTAGVTFNGRLGTMTTQGDRAFRQMSVAVNGVAIFNNDVAAQNFNVLGDGSTLTFNGAGAGPQMLIGNGGGNGSMALDDGTIILGSNIDNGDVIFDVTTGTDGDTAFAVVGTPTINVQVGINVQAGDVVTLVDGDFTETISLAEFNAFNVADNAFTAFTLARTADGATANTNLVITATARTDAQAAATLGISTDQANLLRQAASSGDTTLVDLLTTSINAGPAQTTQAARQVGVQSETVAGGSTVSREMAGQQQRITQDRTGGFRADDPRFVTAFAAVENGETGFAGGDLDGLYTPMGPRYANSVWGQVYGGTALADGTTALAGFDAGFGGAMIGIDGAISDDVVIGAFAGYGFADVDGDGAGNAQLEVSAYQAGVYAGYTGASFYVDAFAAYAMLQNDTTRTTLGPNTVTGEFDASQISVGLSGGAPIAISANGYLTPNASLTWNHYDADGYTETGVGANTVTGFTANTLTGSIGGRLHAVYEISDGSAIIPELSVGLIYDIIDDDGRASATFVGGGAAYTVSGTEISNIGAAIGAGLTMRNDVWSVGLSYDGDIRSDFMSHTGRAEVRMRF